MRVRRRSFLILVLVAACRREAAKGSKAEPPVVTDASTDLLLTWIDDHGEFHVEQRVADVPPSAREVVRVVDMAKDAPDEDTIFAADLRSSGEGGKYPVRAIKRAEFDGIAAERRTKAGKGVLSAAPAASAAPVAGPDVIIYGASWCGPCHEAAAHLKRKNVRFVEKDIEADSGAAREMQAKLARVGRQGGSIPVLDVRGKILVGFSAQAVDQALAR